MMGVIVFIDLNHQNEILITLISVVAILLIGMLLFTQLYLAVKSNCE